ncbi:hypothetical protein G5C60_39925 [Streptomyces sp. HC44]|uniref:Lipoprotein n=1 Tax=Streptomyces scabichelini TaxID=2711217 RepID=A0A6G4VI09_9ACTN|nr:hypothetical protein [Streptomyces scabichelini]NGO13601.1 hypothetical protein [Streptomyces scabichelini]
MRTGDSRSSLAVGLLLVPALLASAVALSGCGTSERVRELTVTERALVRQAEEELVRRCMAAEGFRYWPVSVPDPEALREFEYVVDDVSWASRHGYGPDAPATGPNETYRARLSPASKRRYDSALDGNGRRSLRDTLPTGQTVESPAEGCSATAERKLYGDRAVWFHARVVADNLAPLYREKVLSDPRYRSAERSWSACMRERGLRYSSPGQAREKALGGEQNAAEIRTAVAEARCARRTGLGETAMELDRTFGASARERYSEEIATRNRLRLQAHAKARTINVAQR